MRDLRSSAFILIVIATLPVETILGDKTVSQPVLITVTGTIIKAAMHLKKLQEIASHRVHENNQTLPLRSPKNVFSASFSVMRKFKLLTHYQQHR